MLASGCYYNESGNIPQNVSRSSLPVVSVAHLFPPLLRRTLQLSGLVIFGVEQVDVIGGVADQHLLTVLAVAEGSDATRLVGQVSGNKPHAHACRSPTRVVP